MKPITARCLSAVCAAAMFSSLFAVAAQAELAVPLDGNQTIGNANSATAKQAQAQQKALQQSGTAGSAGGTFSKNLNFTTSNAVKGNINAANSAQVNIGGLDLGGGKSGGDTGPGDTSSNTSNGRGNTSDNTRIRDSVSIQDKWNEAVANQARLASATKEAVTNYYNGNIEDIKQWADSKLELNQRATADFRDLYWGMLAEKLGDLVADKIVGAIMNGDMAELADLKKDIALELADPKIYALFTLCVRMCIARAGCLVFYKDFTNMCKEEINTTDQMNSIFNKLNDLNTWATSSVDLFVATREVYGSGDLSGTLVSSVTNSAIENKLFGNVPIIKDIVSILKKVYELPGETFRNSKNVADIFSVTKALQSTPDEYFDNKRAEFNAEVQRARLEAEAQFSPTANGVPLTRGGFLSLPSTRP